WPESSSPQVRKSWKSRQHSAAQIIGHERGDVKRFCRLFRHSSSIVRADADAIGESGPDCAPADPGGCHSALAVDVFGDLPKVLVTAHVERAVSNGGRAIDGFAERRLGQHFAAAG